MSHLLDVYYRCVHPLFPILPGRRAIDNLVTAAASTNSNGMTEMSGDGQPGDESMALLLAICGYAGQLLPSSSDTMPVTSSSPAISTLINTNNFVTLGVGLANKIAADLWYEQSRTLAMKGLRRRGSSLEGVQTLLLCALRDQGKGGESQAWLLIGKCAGSFMNNDNHLGTLDQN
jgi:hypothetical protein